MSNKVITRANIKKRNVTALLFSITAEEEETRRNHCCVYRTNLYLLKRKSTGMPRKKKSQRQYCLADNYTAKHKLTFFASYCTDAMCLSSHDIKKSPGIG